MIRNGKFSIRSIQSRIGRWTFESAFEPVAPSIKADGEETRQSINPQIVCESHRHSLFSGRSTAAAATVCRLPWSQDAVSQAHCLTRRSVGREQGRARLHRASCPGERLSAPNRREPGLRWALPPAYASGPAVTAEMGSCAQRGPGRSRDVHRGIAALRAAFPRAREGSLAIIWLDSPREGAARWEADEFPVHVAERPVVGPFALLPHGRQLHSAARALARVLQAVDRCVGLFSKMCQRQFR
jgi:hypothetical protein